MSKENFIQKITKDSKKRHLYIGVLLFGILSFFVIFSNNGLFTRLELELEKKEIYEDIENRKIELDELNEDIELLETDTLEIERIAREKYGYVKEGETMYIIKKNDK